MLWIRMCLLMGGRGVMDDELERLEIDLEIADVGEILEAHGIAPTQELVVALWDWKEARLNAAKGEAMGA